MNYQTLFAPFSLLKALSVKTTIPYRKPGSEMFPQNDGVCFDFDQNVL